MTLLKLSDTVRAKLRPALAPIHDGYRHIAHALLDGKGTREIADLLGVSEPEATKRVAQVVPALCLIAFAQRCEVSSHITGELVAVSPDLERGLYRVVHDNYAHERQDGSATFAVMAHSGASVGLHYGERPPAGEWISAGGSAESQP